MNVFLFKINYYNSIEEVEKKAFTTIRADSFAKAVEEIERYYGEELTGFTVDWIDDDIVFISEEAYNRMLNGELC